MVNFRHWVRVRDKIRIKIRIRRTMVRVRVVFRVRVRWWGGGDAICGERKRVGTVKKNV